MSEQHTKAVLFLALNPASRGDRHYGAAFYPFEVFLFVYVCNPMSASQPLGGL